MGDTLNTSTTIANPVTETETAELVWIRNDLTVPFTENTSSFGAGTGTSIITNQQFGWGAFNYFYVISTVDGSTVWDTTPITNANGGGIPNEPTNFRPIAYDGRNNTIIGTANTSSTATMPFYRAILQSITGAQTTVGEVVADQCARAGLLPTDYDVSQLTQVISGYLISKRSDPRTVIRQLGEIFQFDCIETNYILKFVPKNTAIVATIPQNDMGEVKNSRGNSENNDNYFKHIKKQETDLPYEVHVRYLDPARNYQFGDQNSRRPQNPVTSMNARAVTSFEAPIAMAAADAVTLSQTLLYNEWVERDSYETSLGYKWMFLDPTDGVLFTFNNGDNYQARVVEQTIGADFSQAIKAVAVDNETFFPTAVAPTSDNLIISGNGFATMTTSVLVIDMPFFYDTDVVNDTTAKTYHTCIAYASGTWPGGEVMLSTSGSNFQYDNFQTRLPFAGTLTSALPPTGSPFIVDFNTSITVRPYRPVTLTLASTTPLGLLGGENWAIVGKEIIGFQNASVNSDGSYTLTGLIRGLRGTQYACNTHTPGEAFILIDEAVFGVNVYTSAEVGQTWLFKASTFGMAVDLAPVQTLTLTGASLRPRPVANITRTSDGSGGVNVSWERCTRYGGNLVDGTGTVPLNEASETYNAYILSAPYDDTTFNENAPTTYVRSFLGLTSPSFDYTASNATTDGFSVMTDTLHVVVFQVSATVGNGFPSAADLLPF